MQPKTDEEIKTLATETFNRQIFWMTMLDRIEDATMVFMPLALIDPEEGKKLADEKPVLFEYLHKAGPRSVNGYPCFFSFQWISQDDYERMRAKLAEIIAAVDAV